MPVVLAIEPDLRQADILERVIKEKVRAELVVVDSRDAAIAAITAHLPDVMLLSALLSPRDEDELMAHLRGLGHGVEHLQTHTIPQLASIASQRRGSRGGKKLLGAFRRKKGGAVAAGCDPELFADEVQAFLERAAELKAEAVAERQSRVDEIEYQTRTGADAEPSLAANVPNVPRVPADAGVATEAAQTSQGSSAWDSPFEWRRATPPLRVGQEDAESASGTPEPPRGPATVAQPLSPAEHTAPASIAEVVPEPVLVSDVDVQVFRSADEPAPALAMEAAHESAAISDVDVPVFSRAENEDEDDEPIVDAAPAPVVEAAPEPAETSGVDEPIFRPAEAEDDEPAVGAPPEPVIEAAPALISGIIVLGDLDLGPAEAAAPEPAPEPAADAPPEPAPRLDVVGRMARLRDRFRRSRPAAESVAGEPAAAPAQTSVVSPEPAAYRANSAHEATTAPLPEPADTAAEAMAAPVELDITAALGPAVEEPATWAMAEAIDITPEPAAAAGEAESFDVEVLAEPNAGAAPVDTPVARAPEPRRATKRSAAPAATVRLTPLAMWARTETGAPVVRTDAADAERTGADELRDLIAGLSVPPHVASVSYPRGCRIRRVRVPAGTREAGPVPGPVILSKRALADRKAETAR